MMDNLELKPYLLKGKVWVIRQSNVDTDMIFHNRYLHITDRKEMGMFIFRGLPGWENFHQKVTIGDILIVGHNFGCGSSRQQAVDGIKSLGIAAVVGESFGAIYKRNAINAGLPLLECPGILESPIQTGDVVEIDLENGVVANTNKEWKVQCLKGGMSEVHKTLYQAGGLMEFAVRMIEMK